MTGISQLSPHGPEGGLSYLGVRSEWQGLREGAREQRGH